MALSKKQMQALRQAAKSLLGGNSPQEKPKKEHLKPVAQATEPGTIVYAGKDAGNIYSGLVYGLPLAGYLDNVNDLPDYPCQ